MNVTICYEDKAEAQLNIHSRYFHIDLHHRIFTRDELLKMKNIDNDHCLKCQLYLTPLNTYLSIVNIQ